MRATRTKQNGDGTATSAIALRSVLIATGGQAKIRKLYQVLSAEETAEFLGMALQTVRNMTSRRELPCLKPGKKVLGY
jgi:excisionase family DNA binding protein